MTRQEVFDFDSVHLYGALCLRLIGGGTDRFDVYQHLENLSGAVLDRDAIRQSRRERYESLVRSSPMLPDILACLEEASQIGLKLGIASSSSRAWVEEYLAELGLLPSFHCVVTREDATNVKPDPELYVLSMKLLGTSSDRAVAI